MMPQTGSRYPQGYPRMLTCCAPVRREAQNTEVMPIWLAALIASCCQATRAGEGATVAWKNVCGKAVYTNAGLDTEVIQPLGVTLPGGQTLVVSWIPGDTAYTVEVYQ